MDNQNPKSPIILWVALGGSAIILIIVGIVYWSINNASPEVTTSTQTISQQSSSPALLATLSPVLPTTTPTTKVHKTPGIVTDVVAAKSLNLKTGEAVGPTSTFGAKDKTIYAVMTLKDPKVNTKIEYVRYLNDKFLDHGSLTVKKATTNNVSFNWTLKKVGALHPVGSYRVKVYTNGSYERDVTYTVTK